MIQLVCGLSLIDAFKKCTYYRVNLGHANTLDKIKQGSRATFNTADDFVMRYNSHYKTMVFAKGNVGDIIFYADMNIKDKQFAVYIDNQEYPFIFEEDKLKEYNINGYLGWIIKTSKEKHAIVSENLNKVHEEPKPVVGDANKLINDPGMATWDDISAYMKKRKR